jgi:hypothetical protein
LRNGIGRALGAESYRFNSDLCTWFAISNNHPSPL